MSTLRDLRGVPFAQVEVKVLRDPTITPQCKALYSLLVTYGPENIFPGQERLAKELGTSRQSISKWLHQLKKCKLITWVRRGSTSNEYHLIGPKKPQCKAEVTSEDDVKPALQQMSSPVDNRCKPGFTRSISSELDPVIQEESAEAPSAEPDPPEPVIPSTFPEWQAAVKDRPNRPATLRWMIEVLYPGLDPPGYGYIGRAARKVGGAGRLADLLWQHSPHPPTGDLLAYIQGVAKGRGKDNGRTERKTVPRQIVTGWEDSAVEPVPKPNDGG